MSDPFLNQGLLDRCYYFWGELFFIIIKNKNKNIFAKKIETKRSQFYDNPPKQGNLFAEYIQAIVELLAHIAAI